jgi:CRP-like cAMP-binding protein
MVVDLTRSPAVGQQRRRIGLSVVRRAILTAVSVDDLRRAPLFTGLTDDQLGELAGIALPVDLPAAAAIFLQGDLADAFYLLAEGSVKILKAFRDGRTATIRHVGTGETFGESVLFNDTYPATAETMAASRLYRFGSDDFRRLMLAEPELGLRIIAAMAHLLVMLNHRVEELLLPVPARLARYLLDLCSEQGSATHCHLAVSKQELAARLGTVPETLSRTLNRFVRGGLIIVAGSTFEVLNRSALERLAQQ